jgi:hypothetical protein
MNPTTRIAWPHRRQRSGSTSKIRRRAAGAWPHRRHYGRFVNLWKDADAALQPVVQEVRQRMTRLAREQP